MIVVGGILITAVLAAFIAIIAVYEGVVLWIVWSWFIVPLGVPAITIPWAIGLSLVVGLLNNATLRPNDDAKWNHALDVLMKPLIVLVCAWIVKQFM